MGLRLILISLGVCGLSLDLSYLSAALVLLSGTTGRPKAALGSHRNFISNQWVAMLGAMRGASGFLIDPVVFRPFSALSLTTSLTSSEGRNAGSPDAASPRGPATRDAARRPLVPRDGRVDSRRHDIERRKTDHRVQI